MRRDVAVCLLLAMCTAAVYTQTPGHAFIPYDDNEYLYENPHVRRGLTWEGVRWALTTFQASNWHPLTWLSHMLDCEIFGLQAGYHHLVNVFLHVLNSLLLYLVLGRMTRAPWRSAAVASLFALHPLHVESVAWVSERKDVLSSLFFMLTLWAYAAYAARPGLARYVPVFGLLALGLMAKPMLVTLPFVLLLLDYWPLGRISGFEWPGAEGARAGTRTRQEMGRARAARVLLEKAPLLALAAASSVITFAAQHRGGATASAHVIPMGMRAANAVVSYAAYLAKMLWPRDLSVFYPYRHAVGIADWMGAALLLSGVTAGVLLAGRTRRYLAVGWSWYLGMLVPVIGLVQVGQQSMADRYTYLPLIGPFIMGVWGLTDLFAHRRHGRILLTGAAASAILACAAASWVRVSHWRDGITLFEQALSVTEANAVAHNNLGLALQEQGRTDEAIRHYREALRIDPSMDNAHGNLGNALIEQGSREEGIRHYEEAIRANPASAKALNNLGNEWMALGDSKKAIRLYEEALKVQPDQAATHSNLGNALMAEGRQREAVAHYREALRIDPAFADAHNNLGLSLVRQGKRDGAIVHLREALRLDPDHADAHYNMALVLADEGRHREAVGHYLEAIRLRPDQPGAYNNLAWIRATHPNPALRNGAEAVRWAERACALWKGREPHLLDTLAAAYAEAGRFAEAVVKVEEAIELVKADGPKDLVHELEMRLRLYKAGLAHRETRAADHPPKH